MEILKGKIRVLIFEAKVRLLYSFRKGKRYSSSASRQKTVIKTDTSMNSKFVYFFSQIMNKQTYILDWKRRYVVKCTSLIVLCKTKQKLSRYEIKASETSKM